MTRKTNDAGASVMQPFTIEAGTGSSPGNKVPVEHERRSVQQRRPAVERGSGHRVWVSSRCRKIVEERTRRGIPVEIDQQQRGACVPAAKVAPFEVRGLEAIATENAVEGCVRETFGAAVAAVQAKRAGYRRFRAAIGRIARDEAQHAQLSWAVADWIEPRLDAGARRRVRDARERAGDELLQAAGSVEPCESVSRELGVPSAAEARAIALSLRASMG